LGSGKGKAMDAAANDASEFFVVKLWEVQLAGGHTEWRGEMLDVATGRTRPFADWPEMIEAIADTLRESSPRPPAMLGRGTREA
jgi:hypothetical protein